MGRRGSDGGRARPRRWWDELAYRAAQGSFSTKGTFTLRKLADHDAAKLQDVLADVYRDAVPDPADMTKFEW